MRAQRCRGSSYWPCSLALLIGSARWQSSLTNRFDQTNTPKVQKQDSAPQEALGNGVGRRGEYSA